MAAPVPAQESSNDLSPRRKTVVLVNAYEKEMVHNLAKHALGSRIPLVAGSAIVDIGNSRIIGTSLSVESNVFSELFKRPVILYSIHFSHDYMQGVYPNIFSKLFLEIASPRTQGFSVII